MLILNSGLEVAVALLSHFKIFKGVTCFIHTDEDEEDDHYYHIQLPSDTPKTGIGAGKNVSIVA